MATETRRAARPGRRITVWPENAEAFALFCAMGTQWRWAEGLRVGLDLTALPVVAAAHGVAVTPGLLDRLGICEAAALAAWEERRPRRRQPREE
ncbi:DUF1799 domain-containing protein [Roseospirillum parvum]|uniref:DUF1799 domain-containing protein n=1 Tax=Roseospirillum parvum TaxID=83401 RepID=A0A1G8EWJ9_9PROT|nr:DUF1799 domain-containing protein [Roseospirillum parvum]SDH74286.1 Phage related hypothetical protein [Roseospirillum parvum]